ncbi:MAG: nuclear transport factor 2 family protein [Ilumatobacteraceae bacterium]
MNHPNSDRYRQVYDALWNDADVGPMLDWLGDDVVWTNDIGAGPFHRFEGKAAVMGLWVRWNALFDGGFNHELVDVCASDDNVVAILHEVGSARGHQFDNLALYRFELDTSGQIRVVRTYDRDRDAIARFWDAVGAVDN